MIDDIILWILAVAGAVSLLLCEVRRLLDQIPSLVASWYSARRALRGCRLESADADAGVTTLSHRDGEPPDAGAEAELAEPVRRLDTEECR